MFQGEDPDAWWKEIEPRTRPNPPAEDAWVPMDEVSQKNQLDLANISRVEMWRKTRISSKTTPMLSKA